MDRTTPTDVFLGELKDLEELERLAVDAAREAGAYLLSASKRELPKIDRKSSSTDYVTELDRNAELIIREQISAVRPDDGILGEEHQELIGKSGVRWIVDPIDGTTNFISHIPAWCVSIACEDSDGQTLAGVVYDPTHDELFAAKRGGVATLNGEPIEAVERRPLSTAIVATGCHYIRLQRTFQAEVFTRLLPVVGDIRRCGAAALDLAWTATGRFDVYFERGIKRWDVAAGELLCECMGLEVRQLPQQGSELPGSLAAPAQFVDELYALVVGDLT